MQVRLGNLDVVTKDGIELNFERGNAGSSTFPLLDLRQYLLAVARKFAQVVEISIYSGGYYSAIGKGQWRLRHNRLVDAAAQIAELVEQSVQSLQAFRCKPS